MEPLTISASDAAKALGIGKTNVWALIRHGKLDAVRIGRRTLVTIESIKRLAGGAA